MGERLSKILANAAAALSEASEEARKEDGVPSQPRGRCATERALTHYARLMHRKTLTIIRGKPLMPVGSVRGTTTCMFQLRHTARLVRYTIGRGNRLKDHQIAHGVAVVAKELSYEGTCGQEETLNKQIGIVIGLLARIHENMTSYQDSATRYADKKEYD